MIPDEAVEAAARAVAARTLGLGKWEDMSGSTQGAFLQDARAALEAADPHLLARVSTLEELTILEPGTVIQGPDFHGETYKCTAPGTFHAIASPTEYRPSELVGRGPFTIIHKGGTA